MRVVILSLAIASPGLAAPQRIPIAVIHIADRGFIDPKDADSIRDIQKELRGCTALREVPERQSTTTQLEDFPRLFVAVSRTTNKLDGAFPTYYESLDAMVMVTPPDIAATTPDYVKLIYKVGGTGQWRYAAGQVVKELCEWVKVNRDRILNQPDQPQRF